MNEKNPAQDSEQRGLIWCYTDKLSYAPGEVVAFHVSSKSPTYTIEIARVGLTREVVWEKSNVAANWYDIPEKANENGCQWPISTTLEVPMGWRSGYYQVMVKAEGLSGRYAQSEHFFVVRSATPGKDSKILFVLSSNTYIAYNSWGGGNLYSSKQVFEFHQDVSYQASILRPFEPGLLSKFPGAPRMMFPLGKELAPLHEQGRPYRPFSIEAEVDYWTGPSGYLGRWEDIFTKWMEKNGFSADYAIQYDIDSNPEILESYHIYLSVGHDEYWSWKERDAVETWIESGGNLAMFSGNSVFWQVRFENDGERMVCYKHKATTLDPVMGTPEERYVTSIWSSNVINRPENKLTGVSFTRGGYARTGMSVPRGSAGYTVYRPDHWAFEGTGLEYGDVLGSQEGIIGYENDGCLFQMKDGLPYPTGEDGSLMEMEILAMTPVSPAERTDRGYVDLKIGDSELHTFARELLGEDTLENREKFRYGHAMMVHFSLGRGNVFNSGGTEWAYGIEGGNPFIEKITDNVLRRFLS